MQSLQALAMIQNFNTAQQIAKNWRWVEEEASWLFAYGDHRNGWVGMTDEGYTFCTCDTVDNPTPINSLKHLRELIICTPESEAEYLARWDETEAEELQAA